MHEVQVLESQRFSAYYLESRQSQLSFLIVPACGCVSSPGASFLGGPLGTSSHHPGPEALLDISVLELVSTAFKGVCLLICLHQTVIKIINIHGVTNSGNICRKMLFISQAFSVCCLVNPPFALLYSLSIPFQPALCPGGKSC